uniref:Uncharacterized protein n=1 Tax=Plectus sambesii TaxID=2011161 RepID=A0A914VDK9_9BILA
MPNVNFRSRFNWKYITNDANTLVVIIVLLLNLIIIAVPTAFVLWNWAKIPEEDRWIYSWAIALYICTGCGFGCCCLCCCQFCTRIKTQSSFPFLGFKKRGPMIQEEPKDSAQVLVEKGRV